MSGEDEKAKEIVAALKPATNLDEVKGELYKAFNLAIRYGHHDYAYNNNESHQAAALSLQAAAEIAKAIVAIEQVQEEKANTRYKPLERHP